MKNNNPFASGSLVAVSNIDGGRVAYRKATILGIKENATNGANDTNVAENYHKGKTNSYTVRFCDNKHEAIVSSLAIHDISLIDKQSHKLF